MSEMVAEIRSTRQEEADACLPLPPRPTNSELWSLVLGCGNRMISSQV